MKVEMTIPDLSTTGDTVKVTGWLVGIGQLVKQGQPLLEVETDKATMEVEAYVTGVLREILVDAGAEVLVGQVIARIETQEDTLPAERQAERKSPAPAAPVPTRKPEVGATATAEPRPVGMFARNRQKAAQVSTSATHEPAPGNEPGVIPGKLPGALSWSVAQRVVAQRMQASKGEIPHYYLQISANAGAMIARRNNTPGEKTIWDAYFVFAAGRALKQYPRMCARIVDGSLSASPVDAVGVAVDQESDLYVISIADPAASSPEAISSEIRAQVQRLKEGDPEARKIRPNNLTISNLGATGVESFTAIINPPEAAILAIGKIAPTVVALEGQPAIQDRVMLTLSVDHRIVNGRYAAEFLYAIARELEAL